MKSGARRAVVAALAVLVPLTALHAMTVAAFLQKAEALERLGPAAFFSSDYRLLKGEVDAAADALRAERAAARRARRRLAYCPPENPAIDSAELLAHFRSIPPRQRSRLQVRDALRGLLIRKYPCRR